MAACPPLLYRFRPMTRTSSALGPVSDSPLSDRTSGSSYKAANEFTAPATAELFELTPARVLPNSLSNKPMFDVLSVSMQQARIAPDDSALGPSTNRSPPTP